MKILGYLDDAMNWFINWQVSIGQWNAIVIPIEIMIIFMGILYLWDHWRQGVE